MGLSQPWKPASQHNTIEAVVKSEVLPEVFDRLKNKMHERAAAAREAEARASSLRQLSELFNLPIHGSRVPSPWQNEVSSRADV
ncbi:MAG: hypothetical protein RIC24_06500 [Hyphomicrobiales bacterium]|jgi:predicted component of type VI protein secretion system